MKKLVEVLKKFKGKEALLLAHKNADPDSICSALALYKELEKIGIRTRIGAVESVSSLSKKILEKTKTTVEINPTLDTDLIILLDMSSSGQLGEFYKEIKKSSVYKIVIDHHAIQEDNFKVNLSYIDENAATAVELVYDLLRELKVKISDETAFAILFGTVAETAHLRYAKQKNFKIIADLLEKHNICFSELLRFLETPLDISERIARLKAFQRAKVHRISNYLVAISEIGSFEASSARAFISAGADVAAVISKRKKEIRVSLRASTSFYRETKIDLGKDLIPEVAKIIKGTGSGHPTAAGANGSAVESAEKIKEFVIKFIRGRVR